MMLVGLLAIVQEVSPVAHPEVSVRVTPVSTGPDVGEAVTASVPFTIAVSAETNSAIRRISRVTA